MSGATTDNGVAERVAWEIFGLDEGDVVKYKEDFWRAESIRLEVDKVDLVGVSPQNHQERHYNVDLSEINPEG